MIARRYSKFLAAIITGLTLLSMVSTSARAAAGNKIEPKSDKTESFTELENGVIRQETSTDPAFTTFDLNNKLSVSNLQDYDCQWYSGGPGRDTLLTSIAIDPNNPDILYAASHNLGLFKSIDRGHSWTQFSVPVSMALIADPFSSGVLYSGTWGSGSYHVTRIEQGGLTYTLQNVGDGIVAGLAISGSTPGVLYAAGFLHIYKTTNSGDSWNNVWTSSKTSGGFSNYGLGVAINPTNPNIALVTTTDSNNYSVMKTTDGGTTWTPTSLAGFQSLDIVFDPIESNIAYAATWDGGVQKSVDFGETWVNVTTSLPSQYAKAIVIDPNDHLRLYAAVGWWSSGDDIYTSGNGGLTWQHLGGLMSYSGAYGIAIDDFGMLHIATWQAGVWSCDTTFIAPSTISGNVRDDSSNPLSDVLITVTTQLGKTVATTTSIANGNYQVPGLASGTYLIYASKTDYIFNPYPLTVILDANRAGQNFLGSFSSCILPSGINSVDALANMCRIPTAQPFLDLPFTYSDFVISANAREGSLPGLVTAWMDHDRKAGKVRTWGTNQSSNVGSMCSPSDPISLCYDQHEGTDFALSVGTPVKPAAPGLVVEVCKDPPCGRGRGYGRYVLIDHENGYATLYAHLQSVSVVVGKRFYPNTPFEPLGTSGRSGGDANIPFSDTYWNPHLHFGLYFDLDNSGTWTIGEEVDPYGWKPPNNSSDPMGRPNIYMWKYPINVSYCYTPSTETQTAQFGNMIASFPAASLTTDTTVTLGIGSLPSNLLEALRNASQSFFLSLIQWIQAGSSQYTIQQSSTNLATPASVTLEYDPTAILHLVVSQLAINRWDDLSGSWIALPTTLDTIAHTATAQTDSGGSFILQAPLVCPADTLEPNDNYDGATVVKTDGTLVSNLFDIATDEDWFKFVGAAGAEYHIQTTNLSTGVDTVLEIYDTDGMTLLLTDDNSGGGNASSLTWQAPADGTYFVRVIQAGGSAFGCDASYEIVITATYRIYLPLVIR